MLTPALLLSSLLLPQQPAPTPAPAANVDVVELQSGELLQGRIVLQADDYLEIEVSPGAVVGCSRGQIRAVRKAAAAAPAGVAAAAAQPYDRWFQLHDGSGTAVGWLHSSLTVDADGIALHDEWEFQQGKNRFAITVLEHADAALQPRSSYYHERVVESQPLLAGRERVVEERIVEARLYGDELVVQRLTNSQRDERRIAAPLATTFPLLLRQRARLQAAGAPIDEASVYDAATEELKRWRVLPPRRRTVQVDGEPAEITELQIDRGTLRNVEWLAAGQQLLRAEIAGPALVAVPCEAAAARQLALADKLPSALCAEAGNRFGLWAPNPAWQRAGEARRDQVVLECTLRQARASLVLIDHLDEGTELDSAAAAVQRWCQLLHPELEFGETAVADVRERRAIRVAGQRRDGRDGLCVQVFVLPWHERFLALMLQAPQPFWSELEGDFAALQRTVELDAAGIEPVVQGPLLRQARAGAGRGVAAGEVDVEAPRPDAGGVVGMPAGGSPVPNVRVPRDQ